MFVEEVDPASRKIWEANVAAHEYGMTLLKPGKSCAEITAQINDFLAERQLLQYRTFGYGHSFGILSHYYGREAGLELREDIDTIKFGDAKGYAGLCSVDLTGRNILINRDEWMLYTENIRLELIAHELGHCNWDASDTKDGSLMDGTQYHFDTPAKKTFLLWMYGKAAPTEQDTTRQD